MTRALRSGAPLSVLAALLVGLFALDNILLLQFLGLSPWLTVLAAILACRMLAIMAARAVKTDIHVPWSAIGLAAPLAIMAYLLGGEGRFFYANADWQVRDAILADMAQHPWPFAYQLKGEAALLRAPLGLYLLPALAGGGWHEIAMLLSNALRLTLLIALSWPLFQSNRARAIALTVFLLFSGWDIVGTALFAQFGADLSWDHIERWNFNNQFSSHMTQIFWVPQHALAGWVCTVGFLLWRRGIAHIGLFAALIPLVAIWSPLAIMGAAPFAVLAGLRVLRNCDWKPSDIGFAAASLAISLPAFFYLQIDAEKLGVSMRDMSFASYFLLMLLEVLPFLLPVLLVKSSAGGDSTTIWLVFACLLLMPLLQIGVNSDFQMRASIMPLALLSLAFADWLADLSRRTDRMLIAYALATVAIGAVTPALELRRALTFDLSPPPRCSLVGMWEKQRGLMIAPYGQYLAPARSFPDFVPRPVVRAGLDDPANCWDRPWVAA